MQCRMGAFVPHADLGRVQALLALQSRDRSRPPSRVLESMLRRAFTSPSAQREQLPDLLEVLPGWHSMRESVAELRSALEGRCAAGERIELTHCEWVPDRYVAIAGVQPSMRGTVRLGDQICGGFALYGEDGETPRLLPRILRVVCSNGAMVLGGYREDLLARGMDIREGVALCLGGAPLREFTGAARSLAALPIADAGEWLADVEDGRQRTAALAEFARARDPSAWGLVNAITASARAIEDLPRRFRSEEAAGRLVERLLGSGRRGPVRHARVGAAIRG